MKVPRRFLLLLGMASIAVACSSPRPVDPLAERCREAVEYLLPDWNDLRVVRASRSGDPLAVTLRVEGVVADSKESASEHATCAFRSGERPAALRLVIGDRTLDAKALALVNSELLLRDLGRGDV